MTALSVRETRRRASRPYLWAAGIYLGVRVFGVLVLAVFAARNGQPLLDRLTAWDGQWYLAIADHGYTGITGGLLDADGNFAPSTPRAFFPAYPVLLHALATVAGFGSAFTGLLISVVAGVVAACGVFRCARLAGGDERIGLLLVALWAGGPMAITLSMVYTEALFTAFAAWALAGVMERRWLLTALCCVGAGLTRPTAVVLVTVVVIAALVAFGRSPGRGPAACALLAPVGLVGYWVWVADRTGSVTGWFDLERAGWHTRFDGGAETARFVWEQLTSGSSVMETLNVFIVLLAMASAVLLARWLKARPVWWPIALFGIGMVVLAVGTAGIPFTKARFLVPGFPLLLPVAFGLAHRRRATALTTAAALVAVGTWFGAYALTGWQYAI
ncbi:hypothetical protein [Amycolatopsis taiwanensis]|uniref:hypothetical protein n=1 Tax=Amycolatopsis taiwanensis TaxID=342230 RepID=UPI0004B3282A|nr:hypothetical protein [Amycolatopsis taiwanensis]